MDPCPHDRGETEEVLYEREVEVSRRPMVHCGHWGVAVLRTLCESCPHRGDPPADPCLEPSTRD